MRFLARMWQWLRSNSSLILLCAVILFVYAFSLPTLTTRPGFWYDEGINVELARNLASFGKLDLIIAPDTFSEEGALLGSTGYPVTAPLAGVYHLFGFGLEQSRLYMLGWMTLLIITVFLFARRRWGDLAAVLVVALLATYPPFYGNGRSVMGEIPGFFFLLLALWGYLERRNSVVVGVLAGLAVVSKPSVYVFALPAVAALYFLDEKKFVSSVKKILLLSIGSLTALVPWVLLYYGYVLSPDTWTTLADHFANPYATAGLSVMDNIRANLASFLTTGTLIYMTLFVGSIGLVASARAEWRMREKALLIFAMLYGLCAFLYYLKSAGYLRYLIALQFLLLMLLVPACAAFLEKWRITGRSAFLATGISTLLLFQTVYLFTGAKLYRVESELQAVAYVEEHFPDATFATINYPTIASLLPPERKYTWLSTHGLQDFGTDITKLPEADLPEIVFISADEYPTYATFLVLHYVLLSDGDSKVRILGLRHIPDPLSSRPVP